MLSLFLQSPQPGTPLTIGVGIVFLACFFIGVLLYFLPTIIGFARKKRNAPAIFILNFFGGWSGIGWIIAIVWAFTEDDPR